MQPPSIQRLLEGSRSLGGQLLAAGLTIATAESCTGGLLASTLTDIAGSSDYVLGGVICYSNAVKQNLLGVRPGTLAQHGAVSPETAAEMARGVRRLLRSDLAVAVTGIAGPGGGSPDKPVGLVYLHLSAPGAELRRREVWPYDRTGNKRATVEAALALVQQYLQRNVDQTSENSIR
jgi:PncC family amidohydrolase